MKQRNTPSHIWSVSKRRIWFKKNLKAIGFHRSNIETNHQHQRCLSVEWYCLNNKLNICKQRWAQSHSFRITIVLYEDLGLIRKKDISDKACNLRKNSKSLSKLLTVISNSMNQFRTEIDKAHLFNISTGKAANDDTSNFLLDIENIGRQKRESFI